MIKNVIQIADLHIRNLRRMDEYQLILKDFIDKCKNLIDQPNEWRIVISGDIFNSKIVSPEAILMVGWFLKELDSICKTIIIAGNHDTLNIDNDNRIDNLTPIFELSKFNNCVYLDNLLDYQSGCYEDDNIIWCLYSVFSAKSRPSDIDSYKINNPNNKFIGLIHGEILSAKTDIGWESETGLSASIFEDLDVVMMGHIHKYQVIKKNGVNLCYPSSLIQQDFGENINGHGFVVWDIEKNTHEFHEIKNPEYGFYKFTIQNENDINENKEHLLNI